ncbi:hypothetical protein [Legionella quateirensis]|nr:hypothetical protein [Legionella quateirensis]
MNFVILNAVKDLLIQAQYHVQKIPRFTRDQVVQVIGILPHNRIGN